MVRDELESGARTHSYLENALAVLDDGIPVIEPPLAARDVESALLETLDPGEAQVIGVAEAVDGTVVTDDGDARAVATRRGVGLTGSIGLLVRFVEADRIAAATADEYLKSWIDEAGFRAPAREFDKFLDE